MFLNTKAISMLLLTILIAVLPACRRFHIVKTPYEKSVTPIPPNYANPAHWAALPQRTTEAADVVPATNPKQYSNQDSLIADVFFVYPTIWMYKPTGPNKWNANVEDEFLNKRIQNTTVKYQATLFNKAGRLYVPYYRMAHLSGYFTKDNTIARRVFDTAYADVKRAFQYYLDNYNNGRPIIIASHSQGTNHAERLLADFFDGKPLKKQLIAAYLVGMPINKERYQTIKPCDSPTETGCFCSWNTFREGFYPKTYQCRGYSDGVATNPITWKMNDGVKIPREENKGALLYNYKKYVPKTNGAQAIEGLVWIKHPRFPFSWLAGMRNYHAGDYNLFYLNVQENAILRTIAFKRKLEIEY